MGRDPPYDENSLLTLAVCTADRLCYVPSMTNGLRLRLAFFKTEGGQEPVREWIQSLYDEEKKRIGKRLLAVQYGWPVGMPLVRKLEDDLWEVRVTLDNRIARIRAALNNRRALTNKPHTSTPALGCR